MTVQGQSEPKGAAKYNRFRAGRAGKQTRNQCMMFRNSWQGSAKADLLHLSRFSGGLPLLIPTDRAAPSYQLLVLSLAILPFVFFLFFTDILNLETCDLLSSFADNCNLL